MFSLKVSFNDLVMPRSMTFPPQVGGDIAYRGDSAYHGDRIYRIKENMRWALILEAISKMPNSPISVSGLNRNPRNINIYSSGYNPSPSLTSNYFSNFEMAS